MHYYTVEGKSCHEIVGRNGKLRPTTIADARKLNLVPSVTTIMDIQAKPGLVIWMQQQLLNAAIETPFHPEEWEVEEWQKTILRKSREITETSAKRGTEIHNKLDRFFSNESVSMDKDWKYIEPAILKIEETFGLEGWISEKSFAKTSEGFAGCVDLHHPTKNIIIDFKTKDKENLKGVAQYDDHKIQLAAYQLGLDMPNNTRRFNLFISTSSKTPGMCNLIECTEFDKYISIFQALVVLWQRKNNYVPRFN